MESRQPVKVVAITFPPQKVRCDDLQANGRLLNAADMHKALEYVRQQREASSTAKLPTHFAKRFKKKDIGIPYSIIAFDDQLYAIYRGVKQEGHLGAGGFGYAKVVQNISTGAWAVLKIAQSFRDDDHEYHMLQKFDMAIGRLDRIAGDGSEFVIAQRREHPSHWTTSQSNIVMKLAKGVPLAELSAENYDLSDAELLQIIIHVLHAYADIAKQNVIHGDITLTNIFYDFVTNKATIIDYGVAARERWFIGGAKRSLVITRGYYAPELNYVEGKRKYRYTHETDIYALGKTIIYLLRDVEHDRVCSRIKNATLRNEILQFCLNSMCHDQPQKRLAIIPVIQYFENLLTLQFNLLPRPFHKVGLLPLHEFREILQAMQASADLPKKIVPEPYHEPESTHFFMRIKRAVMRIFHDKPADSLEENLEVKSESPTKCQLATTQYERMLCVLRLFDEVCLIDTELRDDLDYIRIQQQLGAVRINVSERCFIVPSTSQSIPSNIANYLLTNSHTKHSKHYLISLSHDIALTAAEQAALCVLSIREPLVLADVSASINQFSLQDVAAEYELIMQRLEDIINNPTNSAQIKDEVLSTKNNLAVIYGQKMLTYDVLADVLKSLKKKIKQGDSLLEHTQHHFFSSRASVNEANLRQIKEIEGQVKEWGKAYL